MAPGDTEGTVGGVAGLASAVVAAAVAASTDTVATITGRVSSLSAPTSFPAALRNVGGDVSVEGVSADLRETAVLTVGSTAGVAVEGFWAVIVARVAFVVAGVDMAVVLVVVVVVVAAVVEVRVFADVSGEEDNAGAAAACLFTATATVGAVALVVFGVGLSRDAALDTGLRVGLVTRAIGMEALVDEEGGGEVAVLPDAENCRDPAACLGGLAWMCLRSEMGGERLRSSPSPTRFPDDWVYMRWG